MSDSEMVRRMAACLDHPSVFMGGPSQQNLRNARALLRVMRDPSGLMLAVCFQSSPEQVWRDMIDAALGEGQ